jgi:DUF4097 and DUF4098 domain-containing protein YvlB
MFGDAESVDYSVEVPAGVPVTVKSSSGQVQVDGTSGPVDVSTSSGSVRVSNLAGPLHVQTSSGSVNLTNVSGEVRATTTSGSISGTQLQHVGPVQTNSGSVSLESVFADMTQVTTSSGKVNLKLLPGTAVQLDVHSEHGRVESRGGLQLQNGVTQRDTLTGTIGTPAPGATLTVRTQSGDVVISQ